MKARINFLIVAGCIMANSAYAQLAKASDYFPLQIGNEWEYDHIYQEQYQLFTVTDDSLIADSVRVYKVSRKSKQSAGEWQDGAPYYYHYNADSTILYWTETDFPKTPYEGIPMIDTGHGVEHTWFYIWGDCLCTFAITDTGTGLFFTQEFPWLEVNTIVPESDSLEIDMILWKFVQGIGIIKQNSTDTLIYAKINNIEFGKPIELKVENQNSPTIPNDMNIAIFPNPVSANTAIHIRSIEPQAVELTIIDILGREVMRFTDPSPYSIDKKIHWNGTDRWGNILPNGIYLIVAQQNNIIKTEKIIYFR